ncbi:MAG TPA: acyl carrier protein [Vicinamibacteria bacterium]|nr:acyl carrier protein [Vicinamibacteria bacterium]
MEQDHRRAVQARLAQLLGRKLEQVASEAPLLELVRDPRRLGALVQRLQRDFGVSLNARELLDARSVDRLVTLVADAARDARRAPPGRASPASPPAPGPLERLREEPGAADATAPAPAPAIPMREASGETWASPISYEGERIHAAAVYCSDGRIGDHVDDFLHNGLGLPRYDRLACPGGPVALAGRLTSFWECHSVEEQLRFLLRVHDVRQVVLIAHQPCAYYLERLRVPAAALEPEQQRDLRHAAWAVQRADPALEVAGFLAWAEGGRVRFEKVLATAAIARRVGGWSSRARA